MCVCVYLTIIPLALVGYEMIIANEAYPKLDHWIMQFHPITYLGTNLFFQTGSSCSENLFLVFRQLLAYSAVFK